MSNENLAFQIRRISGFRESYVPCRNPSADVLHEWAEKDNFAWLYSENIRDEYKEVLNRPHLIGRVVNLIRDRAEEVGLHFPIEIPPTPKTILSASALTRVKQIPSSH
jgi:hypothetical protein